MCGMRNTLDGINGRSDIPEERISKLEDRPIENIQTKVQKDKGIERTMLTTKFLFDVFPAYNI